LLKRLNQYDDRNVISSFMPAKKQVTINDRGINRLALAITFVLHLLVLIIYFPSKKIEVTVEPVLYRVPVRMEINKIKPKKVFKKRSVNVVKKKNLAAKKNVAKMVKKDEGKPTSLPGDRDLPKVATSFSPVYPKAALNNNWTGKVALLVSVDRAGMPVKVEVLKSSGHEVLDDNFRKTVLNFYKFKPRRIMGEDVPGKIKLYYVYD
jgi:TonB family protein